MTTLPYRDYNLEHPDITAALRTGYPRGYVEPDVPRCPECGKECERLYLNNQQDIVGCDNCITERFAEDVL